MSTQNESVDQYLQRAREWSVVAHGEQKYGNNPFSYHLAMVVRNLRDVGIADQELLAAGWMHDVAEDTSSTCADIAAEFGSRAASLVWACTGVGRNRKEKEASIFYRLRQEPDALVVKLADRLANTADAKPGDNYWGMYKKEWSRWKEVLRPLTPRCRSQWHCNLLWEQLEALLGK